MFLLLLMGLGAASVKAQVRIGGNTPPSAAAVLDLNATDAANLATGGLVLPRVDLKTSTMQLTTGVANLTGTMVYNVTTTLGRIGVYYWNGNSWVLASLPSTSAADNGKILMSNGTNWVPAANTIFRVIYFTTSGIWSPGASVIEPQTYFANAMCYWTSGSANWGPGYVNSPTTMILSNLSQTAVPSGSSLTVMCVGLSN